MTNPADDTTQPRKGGVGNFTRRFLSNTGPLLILVALWILLMILSEPFRNPNTWGLLALEVAAIGVVSAGQTFVILTGGIDLSVEAMVSFAGVLAAILIAGTSIAGGQIANAAIDHRDHEPNVLEDTQLTTAGLLGDVRP